MRVKHSWNQRNLTQVMRDDKSIFGELCPRTWVQSETYDLFYIHRQMDSQKKPATILDLVKCYV